MTAFASLLRLDRRDIRELKVFDRYGLHRAVFSLFPDVRSPADKSAGSSSGILFADGGNDEQHKKVWILSNRAPAPRISNRYGKVQSRELPGDYLHHGQYRFEIDINPTKCNALTGKREAVRGREAVATWMVDRSPKWGFNIDPARLCVGKIEVLRFKKADHGVVLGQASISGVLDVVDHALFEKSVLMGLGHGRAFGLGLLRVKPILRHPATPPSTA